MHQLCIKSKQLKDAFILRSLYLTIINLHLLNLHNLFITYRQFFSSVLTASTKMCVLFQRFFHFVILQPLKRLIDKLNKQLHPGKRFVSMVTPKIWWKLETNVTLGNYLFSIYHAFINTMSKYIHPVVTS